MEGGGWAGSEQRQSEHFLSDFLMSLLLKLIWSCHCLSLIYLKFVIPREFERGWCSMICADTGSLGDCMFPGEQKREAPASRGQKWTVRQVPA